MVKIQRTAAVWDAIERAGLQGLLDVRMLPPSHETTVALKIRKAYNGYGKHVAMALLGSNLPAPSCKKVIVVDDDIDIYDFESLGWALDCRVDPDDGDISFRRWRFGSLLTTRHCWRRGGTSAGLSEALTAPARAGAREYQEPLFLVPRPHEPMAVASPTSGA